MLVCCARVKMCITSVYDLANGHTLQCVGTFVHVCDCVWVCVGVLLDHS